MRRSRSRSPPSIRKRRSPDRALRAEPDAEATDRPPGLRSRCDRPRGAASLDLDTTVRSRSRASCAQSVRAEIAARDHPGQPVRARRPQPAGRDGQPDPRRGAADPPHAEASGSRRAARKPARPDRVAARPAPFSAEIPTTTTVRRSMRCARCSTNPRRRRHGAATGSSNGLLQALRGESNGAEGFFALLDRIAQEPEKERRPARIPLHLPGARLRRALSRSRGRTPGARSGAQAPVRADRAAPPAPGTRSRRAGAARPRRRRPTPRCRSRHAPTPREQPREAAARAAEAATQPSARSGPFRAVARAAARDLERGCRHRRRGDRVLHAGPAPAGRRHARCGCVDEPAGDQAGNDGRGAACAGDPAPAPARGRPAASAVLATVAQRLPVKVTPENAGGLTIDAEQRAPVRLGQTTPDAARAPRCCRKIAAALDLVPGRDRRGRPCRRHAAPRALSSPTRSFRRRARARWRA